MDETKAVARLPNLDIEIHHRRAPEEAAEYLSISLRATPSFRAMTDHLDVHAMQLFNPLAFWLIAFQVAQEFWAPFLPVPRFLPAPRRDRQTV
ncbi:MAG TPA: hypothetical protein VHT04_00310 [Stellaceae bacterium]|nr:hypothetical protein [Stellaceae bacterium]